MPDRSGRDNGQERPESTIGAAYKQHTAVDDKVGVILDVAVTTGQTNEGEMIEPKVDEVEATIGIEIKTVTADADYAYKDIAILIVLRKSSPIRLGAQCAKTARKSD